MVAGLWLSSLILAGAIGFRLGMWWRAASVHGRHALGSNQARNIINRYEAEYFSSSGNDPADSYEPESHYAVDSEATDQLPVQRSRIARQPQLEDPGAYNI